MPLPRVFAATITTKAAVDVAFWKRLVSGASRNFMRAEIADIAFFRY
jgi:hypothetical protein